MNETVFLQSMKWVTAAAISLLFLLLLINSCETNTPLNGKEPVTQEETCVNNICHVTPDNFWNIQGLISSDRTILLDGGRYNVKRSTFIDFDSVSNITIMGHRYNDTVIYCSPWTSFAFTFSRNAAFITVTGLKIENCGAAIEHASLCGLAECPPPQNERVVSAFHVGGSRNVTLSNIHFENSLGYAVTVNKPLFEETPDLEIDDDGEMKNYQLIMRNCKISNSQIGALMLQGGKSLLVDSLITNSTVGIFSQGAGIEMTNFEFNKCRTTFLDRGTLLVNGKLAVKASSLHVSQEYIEVETGTVTFIGGGDITENGLIAIQSYIMTKSNSTALFTGFNLTQPSSALVLAKSTLDMLETSTLAFTNNTASNGGSVFTLISSRVRMFYKTVLKVIQNTVRERGWVVYSSFDAHLVLKFESGIEISHNVAFGRGKIAEFNSTEVDVSDQASIALHENLVQNDSAVFHINKGSTKLHASASIKCVRNTASDRSVVMLLTGNFSSKDDKVSISIINNIARKQSYIIVSTHSLTLPAIELAYYYSLLNDYTGIHESLFKSKRSPGSENVTDTYVVNDVTPLVLFKIPPDLPIINELPNTDVELEDNKEIDLEETTIPGVSVGISVDLPIPDIPETDEKGVVFDRKTIPHFNGMPATLSKSIFQHRGRITFSGNNLTDRSVGFTCIKCNITNRADLLFAENQCQQSSHLMLLHDAVFSTHEKSLVNFTHNKLYKDSSLLLFVRGLWNMSLDSELSVTKNVARNSFSVLFFSASVALDGLVTVTNNNISNFGALNFISSKASFQSVLEVIGNIAESGGISTDNSFLYFTGEATFLRNMAVNGGGVTLISSVMYVSPDASVSFINNSAEGLGGAMFISKPKTLYVCDILTATAPACSIRVMPSPSLEGCILFKITFIQNTAGIAGNAIYGGQTSACVPSERKDYCSNCPVPGSSNVFENIGINDTSDLSTFTSDPTRVCFCENMVPNCYKVVDTLRVHPGENFNISLAAVGYGLGTVPGSVTARINSERGSGSVLGSELQHSQEIGGRRCHNITYSIASERSTEEISLAVDTQSFGRSLREVKEVVHFQLTRETASISPTLRSPYDSVFETFFHVPVFVNVTLLPCPVGFQLVSGRCVCHQILLDNHIDSCSISNGVASIKRYAPYWIGLPNDTNSSILIHPRCPFDYCKPGDNEITAESPNVQCRNNRSGILCGSCHEGLSIILGSSECKTCSNAYLLSTGIFILVGMGLVVSLTVLDMTVSVGTLNGFIFFANILQANQATFLPPSTSGTNVVITVLSAFVSWLNLDLGVPMCFFDGLTTYVKIWLQFVFPLYILGMVGTIIIASKYSTRMTQLFGTNAVSILATLVLLSYTKVLRILISAFSFTTLEGSQGYSSVVWLPDGNVQYFEPKHAILFAVALIVLLFLGIPYTLTLTLAPWIQRSNITWISSLYNKFKPLFDAYMGPYKDSCRYWMGMSLLVRVVLIVLFSSLSNANTVTGPQLNLLLLTLASSAILAATTALRPYKNKLLNGLEIFHLGLLLTFSATNLYILNSNSATDMSGYIYIVLIGIWFLVFLGVCVGHIWHRVHSVRSGVKPKPPEREMEERRHQWRRGRVRDEENESGEEKMTDANRTTNITSHEGRRDSVFRKSVLELSFN